MRTDGSTTTRPVPAGVLNVAGRIETTLGQERYRKYFEGSTRLRIDGDTLCISVPSTFYADWLGRQFGQTLRDAAASETGVDTVEVKWEVDPHAFGAAPVVHDQPRRGVETEGGALPPVAVSEPASNGPRWRRQSSRHSPGHGDNGLGRYRLEDFVVGESNRLAYAAAARIAEEEAGRSPVGMVFIHGECGVGKTHLLQGVARRFKEQRPGAKVRCTTAERFANEFIASVQAGAAGIEAFRRRHRGLDLLCVDDVQFIAGKSATQSEFLHTYDALDLDGARLVLASDKHPREIARFDRHLVSRCVAGMVVRIDKPDIETRRQIVVRLAARRGLALDRGAIDSIAAACSGSVREIEGALARVQALSHLLGGAEGVATGVTAALVTRAITEEDSGSPRRPVRLHELVEAVCSELRVSVSEVMGVGRHKRVVLARSLAAAIARDLTTHSYPEIARGLGRENHSTVITACQRVRRQIEQNEDCAALAGPDLEGVRLQDLYERLKMVVGRARSA